MLGEDKRQKLDGIVQQMISNQEPEENIQFVVNDFKTKYDVPEAKTEPVKQGFMGRVGEKFDKRIAQAEQIRNNPNMTGIEKGLGYAGKGLGMLVDTATEGVSTLIPDIVKKPIAAYGRNVMNMPVSDTNKTTLGELVQGAGSAYNRFEQNNPRSANLINTAGNAVNAGLGLAMKNPAADMAKRGARATGATITGRLAPATAKIIDKKLTNIVTSGMEKGVRPSVAKQKNVVQSKDYYNNAKSAVNSIIENKNNLMLTDSYGNQVTGLPRSLKQYAEAIDQTKKGIYQKYHQMAIDAGEQGAVFDTKNVLKNLDDVSKDLKHNPQIRKYADDLKSEVGELHGQSPEIIEARIADLNKSLNGFYDGRVSAAKAQVDASTARLLREELDDNIMKATGPGYKDLKKQYGSLREIEKDVNHRALIDARKNTKGLLDLTDIYTGGELTAGILTMNPALIARGAAGKGIKEYVKFINDPNRIVKGMFNKSEKLLNQGQVNAALNSTISGLNQSGALGTLQAPKTIK